MSFPQPPSPPALSAVFQTPMNNLQPPPPSSTRPTSMTPLLRDRSSKESKKTASSVMYFLPLTDPRTRDYIIGIILLLGVVLMWVISSFITSDLFDSGWKKPFWVTYINTSSFAFYLLPFLYRRSFSSPSPSKTTSSQYLPIPPSSTSSSSIPSHRRRSSSQRADGRSVSPMAALHPPLTSSSVRLTKEDGPVEKLSERETATLAALFCGFWFAANWSVNKSLEWTSVGSSTILASMSGFFTLGIGRIFGVETFTRSKLIAVSISFFGVLLVSLADSLGITASLPPSPPLPDLPPSFALLDLPNHLPPPNFRFWGDSLALLSAFFYALYVILLKLKIGEESRIDMQLFFGFVGLWNVILLWPIGLGLHFAGWETIELPTGRAAWTTMAVNMAITLTSDYLYVIAMLKTTPLVVTIGLSLTIPFAVLGDLFRGTSSGGWQALAGAGLVLASFCFMGVEGASELEDEVEADHEHEAALLEESEGEEDDRPTSSYEGSRGRPARTNDGGLGVV